MAEDDEEASAATVNSEDEALLEVLGLASLGCMADDNDDDGSDNNDGDDHADGSTPDACGNGMTASNTSTCSGGSRLSNGARVPLSSRGLPNPTASAIAAILDEWDLPTVYRHDRFAVFPGELSVPASAMRRLADELIWGSNSSVPSCGANGSCRRGYECDRTYETIRVLKRKKRQKADAAQDDGFADANIDMGGHDEGEGKEEEQYEMEERRVLTRLENFVPHHDGWSELCLDYLTALISALYGQPMVLYKEKLNIKPPGGSGFAPHLDGPSLRVALGEEGPQTFVTVMVAIDDMTVRNGCLRVVRGSHSEDNHVEVVLPKADGNPDGDGRAGAIPDEVASTLEFEDVVVKGGTIAAFGDWVPHRSAVNGSPFSRRAVFLTYNPASEGDCRQRYYDTMKEMREGWRRQVGLAGRQQQQQQQTEDERLEMEALASIPKI